MPADTRDRHLSGFMIRLPEEYRDRIRRADPNLTITANVRRALDSYLTRAAKKKPVRV